MLTDGRWTNTWDAENRLISVQTLTTVTNSGVPRQKVDYAYDFQSRRSKRVYSIWTNAAWSATQTNLFIYDGWALIRDTQSGIGVSPVTNSYYWGLDLSGSLQGAGGIGGLVSYTRSSSSVPRFCAYDANGNVTDVLTNGVVAAHFEYDPYGRTIVATGAEASNAVFRFSTKRFDATTGLVLYEYRVYRPELGRWVNRDLIEEQGGINLFAFVGNQPVSGADFLGLLSVSINISSYHGTVEKLIPGSNWAPTYLDTDPPDPPNPPLISRNKAHASISRYTAATSSGGLIMTAASTTLLGIGRHLGVWRVEGLEMSTDNTGQIRVCGSCSSGKVRFQWSTRASLSIGPTQFGAPGPGGSAPRGPGARTSYAWIIRAANTAMATQTSGSDRKSGTDDIQIRDCCAVVDFDTAAVWRDYDVSPAANSQQDISHSWSVARPDRLLP